MHNMQYEKHATCGDMYKHVYSAIFRYFLIEKYQEFTSEVIYLSGSLIENIWPPFKYKAQSHWRTDSEFSFSALVSQILARSAWKYFE